MRTKPPSTVAEDIYNKGVADAAAKEWGEWAQWCKGQMGEPLSYFGSPFTYDQRMHRAGLDAVVLWASSARSHQDHV